MYKQMLFLLKKKSIIILGLVSFLIGVTACGEDQSTAGYTPYPTQGLAAFFGAVNELFGSELAELSAKQWLRELEATDHLPASTSEWQTLTAKASIWLANRVSVLSLTAEFATT